MGGSEQVGTALFGLNDIWPKVRAGFCLILPFSQMSSLKGVRPNVVSVVLGQMSFGQTSLGQVTPRRRNRFKFFVLLRSVLTDKVARFRISVSVSACAQCPICFARVHELPDHTTSLHWQHALLVLKVCVASLHCQCA